MSELIVAIGLVLIIEGLPWLIAPNFATELLKAALSTTKNARRLVGLLAVTAGFLLVWLSILGAANPD